jgi:predicted dehydrogenase
MRHIAVAQASAEVRLVAVVEPDAARRRSLAATGLPVLATLEEVPAEVRAAVIATPTQAHATSAQAALARGMAVLLEKPVAATLGDARAVRDTARRIGAPLIVGHHRRCHPFAIAAKARLGEIGKVVGVQALWSLRKPDAYFDVPWRRRPGAGPVMTNLSHEIDLMAFLLGEIAEVTAFSSNATRGHAVEDTSALALRFAEGALGSVLISDAGVSPWAFEAASGENPGIAASGEDYLRITGTDGAMGFPSMTLWTGSRDWALPLQRREGPSLPRIDPLADQLRRFAGLTAGAEDAVLCSADAGIAALEMTLATALSSAIGRPVARGAVPETYTGAMT